MKMDDKNNIRKLQQGTHKAKIKRSGFSQWIKLMEIKKKLYELEDEIDKMARELKGKRPLK